MGEFSRRDFIKTTCISVGALAASSSGMIHLRWIKVRIYLLAMFW